MNTHQAGLMMAHGQNMASQMMSQGQSQASAMMAHNQNMASQMAGGMPAPGIMAGGAIEAPFGAFLGGTPGADDPPVRGGRMDGGMRIGAPGAEGDPRDVMRRKWASKQGKKPGMPDLPFGGFRADGGPVYPGRAYVVGEEGEEWFVPSAPGTIVPKPKTGMLVASSNGGTKWQPGTGKGATLPPQSSMPRPIDAPFAGGSLTSRAPGGEMTGPLSSRKRQIGGGMTPERRLKQMQRRAITRGDDATVTNIAQAQMGYQARDIDRAFQSEQQGEQRNFMRERDATNHAQGMQMWNLARSFELDAEGRRNQAALDAEARRNQRDDTEWQRRRAAELEDQRNRGIDSVSYLDMGEAGKMPVLRDKGGNLHHAGVQPVKPSRPAPTPDEIARRISSDLMKGVSTHWNGSQFQSEPLRSQAAPAGRETETYDAEGKLTGKTRSRPLGGGTSKAGTGYW